MTEKKERKKQTVSSLYVTSHSHSFLFISMEAKWH